MMTSPMSRRTPAGCARQNERAFWTGLTAAFVGGCAGLVLIQSTAEAAWRIAPVTRLSVQVTDNVDLASDEEEEDAIGTVTQIFNIARLTPQTDLRIFAATSYDAYADRNENDDFRHTLNGDVTFELLPDLLFVDLTGLIEEEEVDEDIPSPALSRAVSTDRQRQYAGLISPYVQLQVFRGVDLEVRGRLAGITYEALGSADDEDISEDSSSYGGLIALGTSTREQGLRWRTELDYSETDDEETELTWINSITVPLRPNLRALARLGYESIESDEIDEDTEDNVLWTVGFEYEPDRRVALRAEGGQRFNDDFYAAEAEVLLAESFNLRGAYTVAFVRDDERDLAAVENFDFENPERGGIDRNTNDDQSAIEEEIRLEIFGTRGTNTYSIGASYLNRDFEASDAEEESYGIDGTFERRLTRSLTGLITAGYEETSETNPDQDTDVVFAVVGFDYAVSRDVTAGIRYGYREQTLDNGEGVTENAGLVQLSKEW